MRDGYEYHRLTPNKAFIIAALLAGTGFFIDFLKSKNSPYQVQQASAQTQPSRTWTKEDSLIAKVMQEDPKQFCTQKGQYFLTPLAQSTLQSKELRYRHIVKKFSLGEICGVITEQEILDEAARLGGDNILTSEEISSSYKRLTRGLGLLDSRTL